MAKVIQIQLGEYRPVVYVDLPDELGVARDDDVIVDVDNHNIPSKLERLRT